MTTDGNASNQPESVKSEAYHIVEPAVMPYPSNTVTVSVTLDKLIEMREYLSDAHYPLVQYDECQLQMAHEAISRLQGVIDMAWLFFDLVTKGDDLKGFQP